ncbi:MAG: cytochrome c biogenesis protein CcsA [Candidatus Alcyoniella australis]|nr:cytochrome c biogenesis protein CcsA [Candidatus Alcyoniella australis]
MAFVVLGLYGLTTLLYLLRFFRPEYALGRYGALALRLTLFVHLAFILLAWNHLGRLPLHNRFEMLSLVIFCYSSLYLILEWRTEQREVGGFVLALATVFFGVSLFALGQPAAADQTLHGPVFTIHVLALTLAYAGLFLGFLFSVLYMLQHYEIKQRRLGVFYQRLPSLGMLATMSNHANSVGWTFLTVGIIAGSIWAKQVWDINIFFDPKPAATLIVWLLYLVNLLLRLAPTWTHKRSAQLTLFSFCSLLFAYGLLTFLASSSHSF